MKQLLKTEEAATLALAVVIFHQTIPFSWWVYWAWFLVPDMSLMGYVVNTQIGALLYNIAHHKGIAIICYLIGIFISSSTLQFAGLLLLGHSSFDRVFGYGLKHPNNFKNTHLGWIGGTSSPG